MGDVHGRADLLKPLVSAIFADALHLIGLGEFKGRPRLVFLGDYVDRGPASSKVIAQLIKLREVKGLDVCCLKGNHEEAMLAFLEEPDFGPTWATWGGGETLASYGVSPPALDADLETWRAASTAFAAALPPAHLDFLNGLALHALVGDYLFVHAGVRPGAPLEAQTADDLLWIREPFLSHAQPSPHVVVHGHTPADEAYLGARRIGVDTGAYMSGVLTAVRLLGDRRDLVQTGRARA